MMRTGFLLLAFIASGCSSEQLTDLMLASGHGDYPAAVKMLDGGADVNQATPSGKTPLMYAASEGHGNLVELLLERGADANATDKEGTAALLLAATSGYDESVKHLLAYGADPAKPNNTGGTPLTNAIFFGRNNVVDMLLEKLPPLDAQHGGELLLMAAGLGHEQIIRIMVKDGVAVNSRGKLNRTPLMAAVEFSRLGAVKTLLELGADRSLTDDDGKDALSIAEKRGNTEIVALLR